MAANAGVTFKGTTISYATTSGGSYTAFGEIVDISDVGESADPIEMTHAESPNGRREYIPGLSDGNDMALTLNTTPAMAALIENTLYNVSPMFYKITLPNADTFVVPGILNNYSHNGAVGDAWRTNISIKIANDKVDFTDTP